MVANTTQPPVAAAPCSFLFCQLFPVAVKFAVYPIDRARLLMQTQWAPGVERGVAELHGTWQIWGQILRREGVLAPWRGFGTTCLRWGPYQCLNLASKDVIGNHAPLYSRDQQWCMYFATKLLVGAAAGVVSALIWGYPLDVIRQHLATNNAVQPAHASDVVRTVWRAQGLHGFYRGFLGDSVGLAIFRGVQLGGWDIVKDCYGKKAWQQQSTLSHFLHAQGISLLGSILSYPCDTIRRNVVRSGSGISYRGCLLSGAKMGGGYVRFFYAGFSARIASSFVNGVMLECWDMTKSQAGS